MDKPNIGNNLPPKLTLTSFGGFGLVTENLFVYEYRGEMIIVDCGIGFPGEQSAVGDLIVPDIRFLEQNRLNIRAIILTHGHEDHIGALPFVLPKLGVNIPIFASRLTGALVQEKLVERGIGARINIIGSGDKIQLGSFSVEWVRVTHSIPDTMNVLIKNPLGTIFHASDFKFDWTPVMGKPADVGKIARAGDRGVLLLVSDCLRSEKPGYTLSESTIEESLEREIRDCHGKFLVTTMSSNVSRWKQAINVIRRHQRKVVLVGRSVEKIIEIAIKLGYLKLDPRSFVDLRQIKRYPPSHLGFLVAGSQAQEGSALERIVRGDSSEIKIVSGDKVVFSTDYIPGNELAIHKMIDQISQLGADASYSEILDDLHVSGHASQEELMLMLALVRPQYILPIGGAYRQMKHYSGLAQKAGYSKERIILPKRNQKVEILPGGRVVLGEEILLQKTIVDSRLPRQRRRGNNPRIR